MMGNREFYKSSDVIFGLRVEYQKIQRKLEELKKYSRLDSEFENLTFSVNSQRRDLVYDYTLKHNRLDRIFSSSLFESGVKKKKGVYCSDEVLTILDSQKFGKKAKDILADDLDLVLSTTFRNKFKKSQEIEMSICPGSIHLHLENIYKLKSPISIHYYSAQDIISVNKERGFLTLDDVYDALTVPIPNDELSSYHIDLIDSADNRKPIILKMKKGLRKSYDFDIISEKDKFVLQKKKR